MHYSAGWHLTNEPNGTLLLTHVRGHAKNLDFLFFFCSRHLQSTREDTFTLHFCAPAACIAHSPTQAVYCSHIQLYSHIGINVFSIFNCKFRLTEVLYLDAYDQIWMTEEKHSMILKKSFVSKSLLESELNFINKIQGSRIAMQQTRDNFPLSQL